MEEFPRKGYAFVYVNVEDIEDEEDFFSVFIRKSFGQRCGYSSDKSVEKKHVAYLKISQSMSNPSRYGTSPSKLNRRKHPNTAKNLKKLMSRMDTSDFTIVMLVDEFPVTVEQIEKKNKSDEAIRFLHTNRSIRQRAKRGIQFIYTGSIGLPNIARKLDATATINDLNVVEVPPLTQAEANAFTIKLLKSYKVKYQRGVISYMLLKLKWLMPFFIQLVVQMLIDEFESNGEEITKELVDKVFDKASNHRNNIYFENYYSRLDKSLMKEECSLAKQILSQIAIKNSLPLDAFKPLRNYAAILEILEFDGYINSNNDCYSFNSPILQNWWIKYAID